VYFFFAQQCPLLYFFFSSYDGFTKSKVLFLAFVMEDVGGVGDLGIALLW